MAGGCRNCGRNEVQALGPIGRVAPFFLKRVMGAEFRPIRSSSPLKQAIRDLAAIPASILSRLSTQYAFVEMQLCLHCSFIQTEIPFHDDDIVRLYYDYRSSSYNRERIHYEPSYAAIAAAVGQDEMEVRSRTAALNAFLRRNLSTIDSLSMLDYGGSDGKFMPDLPGPKFVYEVSNIEPLPGVNRINLESELGTYSIVLLAHVIEHVPHPLNLVRKLSAYVKPGGYLYIETPQEISNQDRDGLRLGSLRFDIGIHEHINSYCVQAVLRLLEYSGFTVTAIESSLVDIGWTKGVHIRALGRKGDAI